MESRGRATALSHIGATARRQVQSDGGKPRFFPLPPRSHWLEEILARRLLLPLRPSKAAEVTFDAGAAPLPEAAREKEVMQSRSPRVNGANGPLCQESPNTKEERDWR